MWRQKIYIFLRFKGSFQTRHCFIICLADLHFLALFFCVRLTKINMIRFGAMLFLSPLI